MGQGQVCRLQGDEWEWLLEGEWVVFHQRLIVRLVATVSALRMRPPGRHDRRVNYADDAWQI